MMFIKSRLRRIILSFVLAITLTLGMTSIGYCGGGFGEPAEENEQYSGPAIVGKLVVIGGDENITVGGQERVKAVKLMFSGRCGTTAINSSADVSSNLYSVPEDISEMLHVRYPNGQSVIEGCEPFNSHKTGEDILINITVQSFEKCENFVSADVVLLWVVPRPVPPVP